MQRYVARRAFQSLLAIWVMSLIVFSLARVTGNPLDVMLPLGLILLYRRLRAV